MTVYRQEFYADPANGAVESLERETERLRRKAILKAIRADKGCASCSIRGNGIAGVYTCLDGHTQGSISRYERQDTHATRQGTRLYRLCPPRNPRHARKCPPYP